MATSLAEQLQRLKAPQTGILLQDKKRASLLFDPKEAANLDRETVFNIGKNGLENLIKLSNLFEEFESTLFARSSIDLERSVLDSKVNKRLDAGIEKFLILLSPHFLLNTAHKALEWLIYRFHIHQYNKDQFMMLILPYHETKMFVRALQVVELENNSDKWHWLQPLQKPGIPLSSSTLVNRVSVDNGFAKLLCQHVINATSIYGEQADSLNTLYTFYTLAIIGGIERSPNITEVQVGHILPALIKGMVSPIPDFVAGNYMILAKLCCKAKLNNETTEVLLTRALKNPILKNELLLLIFFLYEAPDSRLKSVPEKMVSRFSKFSWLCEEITKIKSSGKKIAKFLIPFLESAIRRVLKNISEEEEIKQMVQDIFEKVRFDDYEVDSILMETLKPSLANGKLGNESKSFLSTLYGLLEIRYPLRFDEYLKNLMKNSETCPESKKSLQFLMSWHSGAKNAKNSLDVFDQLNHYTPEYRISALKNLSKGKIEIAEGFEGMVKKSILDRFNDDNVEVVKALLNCPVKTLKSLFPSDNLIERLMILLSQCHTEKKHVLAQPAIKLLLDLCEDGDDTSVFIAILPYLFPNSDEEIKIAMQILRSEFAKKNQYLLNVRKHINDSADPTGIGGAAFHGLFLPELLPPTENIMTTMKLSSNNDATSLFFNLVLLGSVCRRKIGEISAKTFREITEMASDMMRKFPKVKSLPKCNQLTNEQIQPALEYTSQGILPLQAGTYVLEMVYRRLDFKSNQTLDFENNSDFTQLVICIFETILEGQQSNSKQTKEHYFWLLKIFVQRHFQTSQMMIKFLSQCFIEPIKVQTSFHCLEMTLVLLDRSPSFHWIFEDKTFVTNLLIALSRENNDCRDAAVKILQRLVQSFNLELNGCATLFAELAKYSSEISMDAEQLPVILYSLLSPDPDVISSLKKDVKKQFKEMREFLFSVALDSEMPIHVKSQLLEVLAHVNGNEVLKNLTPQGLELMKTMKNEPEKPFVKIALKNILNRFNSTTVKALEDENVWELFEAAVENHELRIPMENAATQVPSVILMKQIDEVFFENAATESGELQKKILGKLVDIVTNCEIGNIVAAANRAVRRIKINAQLVINELEAMKNAQVPDEAGKLLSSVRAKRRSRILEMTKKPEVINTREWKRGITILEFIQRAENIEKEYLLVPVLFDLLRMCLRFEEQSPLEYTNQLLLSTIYNLATKKLPIPDAHLQVDLISQCIRTSQNPQTHHHALLVLVELFKVADVETALHNIMPIFTFMGSSVLRQDDAYSIQIISKTIETVVPIVNAANDERHACEILRVFVISLPDIPEHRRLPLFVKLLQLLENHIHLFFLLTFETHVLVPSKDSDNGKMSSQRLEFALTISQEFSPKTLVDICVKLVNFIKSLPVEIDENSAKNISFSQKHIFDVAKNTPKQLRHYKYTIVQFLSALLSSSNFINRVASLSDEETEIIKPSYDELIIELVLLIQSASKSADLHQGKPKGKYWKVLLHNLYDILDAVNGLLPNQIFISSVKNLINHNHLTVRRKALELMNSRLQQRKFKEDDYDDLLTLINPLLEIISKQGKILSQDVEIIQQTSLITLKLLAKLLALENPGLFKPVLELTTEYLKTKDGPLLGSVVLCVAELCGTMKIHAIQLLNKFLPAIIHLMKIHCHQESPDVLVISIVSALQRIVESVGNFLSLYLDQLLAELCRLSSLYTMDLENQKTTIILSRLKATSQKLANLIPMRVFLPAVSKTYTNLLETKSYKCIPALMSILAESFTNISPSDLQVAIPDLSTFFLRVFQFREDLKEEEPLVNSMEIDGIDILKDIENIEEAAGKSLVALVFKLSEATFRPFYYKLYDWAARNPEQKLRNITFYRLSSNIAECLKSLFVLFAGHFMTHAAQLLAHNNLEIRDGSDTNTLELESNRIELIEAILSTLHKVFSYDANNFVNQERFEILCSPIVDQIENTVGTIEEFEKRAEELIVPCIASFASATQDDSLHKQLVYQVLLKTRHDKSYVRSAALSALVEIARKLGEDFMPLLPETVPFLAELLEDEDEATEKLAQNAVRTLEEVLGEPLQKYF